VRHSAQRTLLQIALKEYETEEHRSYKFYEQFVETLISLIDGHGSAIISSMPFRKKPIKSIFKRKGKKGKRTPVRIPVPGSDPVKWKIVYIQD